MTARIININVNGESHLFTLDNDADIGISIYDHEEHDTSIAAVINGPSGIELGIWDRDGEYIQKWHELSDS